MSIASSGPRSARIAPSAHLPTDKLRPHPTNPRVHKPKQIRKIADSIRQFGFTNPILIDGDANVLAGHGRLAAAKLLDLKTVPTICLDHLSPAEKRAYIIADNKLSDASSFDRQLLADEISIILADDPEFDIELTGFDTDEIELLLDAGGAAEPVETPAPPPDRDRPARCRLGDLWTLGEHRLLCGDALERESYTKLMGGDRARMVFADLPYNQSMSDISGKGRVLHPDFQVASGELTETQFVKFLITACTLMAKFSLNGALQYLCMDWRHLFELLTAGRAVYDRMIDLCVWVKAAPAMGAPYRSQHELIAVFKHGTRAHVDNVQLGKHGRNRANIWSYSTGPNFSADRQQELAWHPTCKPLALVQDAILDATRKDDIILDPFGGSGTTLLAAEATGRRARLIEIDPYYCDVIIKRFESGTGAKAVEANGDQFSDRADGSSHHAPHQGAAS